MKSLAEEMIDAVVALEKAEHGTFTNLGRVHHGNEVFNPSHPTTFHFKAVHKDGGFIEVLLKDGKTQMKSTGITLKEFCKIMSYGVNK